MNPRLKRAQALHRRINRLGPPRCIVQRLDPDGVATPTEAEIEARAAEIEAAGFTPHVIRLRIVNRMPAGARA